VVETGWIGLKEWEEDGNRTLRIRNIVDCIRILNGLNYPPNDDLRTCGRSIDGYEFEGTFGCHCLDVRF
jgi:hypothetical protein